MAREAPGDRPRRDLDWAAGSSRLGDPGDGSFTAMLWFQRNRTGGVEFFASKGNASSSGDGWSIWTESNALFVRGNYGVDGDERQGQSISAADNGVDPGQWHPVALVIDQDAGTFRGYLDGSDDNWVVVPSAPVVSTLDDARGRSPDWVEIYNPGPGPVDLLGWYLTDDASDLTKWNFPSRIPAEESYLVVFTSGCTVVGADCPDAADIAGNTVSDRAGIGVIRSDDDGRFLHARTDPG